MEEEGIDRFRGEDAEENFVDLRYCKLRSFVESTISQSASHKILQTLPLLYKSKTEYLAQYLLPAQIDRYSV